ncbi:MAG: hypothetical protein HY914_18500 [Desulfomonile tiedjei]|nr:hypothetical protein [Desulfomonile tiedjei]
MVSLLATLLVSMCMPAAAANWNATGKWEADVMGAKIHANLVQEGETLKGIVDVYDPWGKKDRYTVRGTVHGDQLQAAHYSGHSFSGRFAPNGQLVGTLRTNGGHSVKISARRR